MHQTAHFDLQCKPSSISRITSLLPNAQATQQEIDEFHADHKLWANVAQNFANLFEICFFPHEHLHGGLQPTFHITWETFCENIAKMETSNMMIE